MLPVALIAFALEEKVCARKTARKPLNRIGMSSRRGDHCVPRRRHFVHHRQSCGLEHCFFRHRNYGRGRCYVHHRSLGLGRCCVRRRNYGYYWSCVHRRSYELDRHFCQSRLHFLWVHYECNHLN